MGQFWLEFDNQGSRQRFDFSQMSVAIGRDPNSDFHLDHPTVSRQHALIVESHGTHQLVVLSQNGLTAINGQKVNGTIDLRAGQLIQLGELQFVFHSPEGFTDNEPATEQVDLNALNAAAESTAPMPVQSSLGHAPTAALPPVGGAPQNGAFGSQVGQPAPSFGSQAGFGAPNQSGFGSQPPQQGFGDPNQSGFGQQQQQQQQGFGAPNDSGFGQQPQQQGFNPQQQQGFGSQPPQQQQGFGQPQGQGQGGFGQLPPGPNGSDGAAPPQGIPNKQDGEGSEEFKIPSWDTIAAQAVEDDAQGPGQTDFQRLQKAQKKATAASKGTNPMLLALGAAGVAGMIYFLLFHKPPPKPVKIEEGVAECARRICPKKPLNCAGREACINAAKNSYKVADKLYKEKDANITNLFEAYRQLDKADVYLSIAGVSQPPEEMKDYPDRMAQYEKDLDEVAKNHRIKLHMYRQRKMYGDMVNTIDSWKAYFPGRDTKWWEEAIEEERTMKDNGTYPASRMKKK